MWWRFARLLTEDLPFGDMHARALEEFAAITRAECLLGAVVAAQIGRADAIADALEIQLLKAQLQAPGRLAA